ncbi:hypothetical protein VTK26DRAFT_2282 [Humicola hyalothermophila]
MTPVGLIGPDANPPKSPFLALRGDSIVLFLLHANGTDRNLRLCCKMRVLLPRLPLFLRSGMWHLIPPIGLF